MSNQKRVVILGGGYLGVKVAGLLDDSFEVIVVEKKDKFNHNIGTPRAFVEAGFEKKILFPYTNLLKRGKVIRDVAVEIQDKAVILQSGETLSFDYLVVATGFSYSAPIKGADDSKETEATFRKFQEALKKAKTAIVVGAGVTGVEVAAEVKTYFPNVEVSLHNSASQILNAVPVTDAFRSAVTVKLEKIGVKIVLNSRINVTLEERDAIMSSPEPRTFKTTTGVDVTSDVQIFVTGLGQPNNAAFKPNFSTYIDADTGRIKVNKYLQLESHPQIFVGGDVALANPIPQAVFADAHAQVIKTNIKALSKKRSLTEYKPSHMMVATVIGKGGQFQGFPFKNSVWGDNVAGMKAKDYILSIAAGALNTTTDGETPPLQKTKSWFGTKSAQQLIAQIPPDEVK